MFFLEKKILEKDEKYSKCMLIVSIIAFFIESLYAFVALQAKASQEKQVRREARRYRVASAALIAAEAYAKALAEERRAVEAAICHVTPTRDEKGDEKGEVKEGDAGGSGDAGSSSKVIAVMVARQAGSSAP